MNINCFQTVTTAGSPLGEGIISKVPTHPSIWHQKWENVLTINIRLRLPATFYWWILPACCTHFGAASVWFPSNQGWMWMNSLSRPAVGFVLHYPHCTELKEIIQYLIPLILSTRTADMTFVTSTNAKRESSQTRISPLLHSLNKDAFLSKLFYTNTLFFFKILSPWASKILWTRHITQHCDTEVEEQIKKQVIILKWLYKGRSNLV